MAVLPVVYENGEHRVGSLSELIVISPSDKNLLSFNTDGGLYIDGNTILSNGEASNLLVISHIDNKIYLSEANLKSAGFLNGISQDSGNLLSVGSDGNPSIKISDLTTAGFLTGQSISTLGYVTRSEVQSMISSGSTVSGDYLTRTEAQLLIQSATSPSTLISTAAGNALTTGSDGKLYASSTGGSVTPSTLISTAAGNALTTGSDGKLFVTSSGSPVTPSELISTAAGNALTTGSDGKLFVTSSGSPVTPSTLVSTTPGNALTTGTDGKLAVTPSALVSTTSGNALTTGTDGKLAVTPSTLVSDATDNALEVHSDGKLYVAPGSVTLPDVIDCGTI